MRLAEYLTSILLFVLGMYSLRICLRNLREVRRIGGSKAYRYTVGAIISVELIFLAVVGFFFALYGSFH